MSNIKKLLSSMSIAVVMVVAFSTPAGASDCTPKVDVSLGSQTTDQGENLETYKFRVDVSQEGGSSCATITYVLALYVQTSDGEEQVVNLRRQTKVRGSAVAMLVAHQISKDDNLTRYEVTNIECHACAPGD